MGSIAPTTSSEALTVDIREIRDSDRDMIDTVIREHWGSEVVVSNGLVHRPSQLDGFIIEDDSKVQGFVTYRIQDGQCEVVSLNSLVQRRGIGRQLLEKVIETAREKQLRRLWLVTTNDNLNAQAFYRRMGLELCEVRVDALEQSRKLKPEIPQFGENGLPIRDEIEFDMYL
jgi:ribosomal protein S18 acetylase RimI-like enzyme